MPENGQSDTQLLGYSPEQLQLKAYSIKKVVDELGIVSNEIQAFGAILESLGAAVTMEGNLIGTEGFELETIATKLHITSVMQELEDHNNGSKSSQLLQLKAYNILLVANEMGVSSNKIQALGAEIQAAAGIVVAYGNLLAVVAFELERMVTGLQIESVLLEIERQNQLKTDGSIQNAQLSAFQHVDSSQQAMLEQLYLNIHQMQDNVNKQQAQIQEIQKSLNRLKEK